MLPLGMGHGHVKPNADGSKARCGGPYACAECHNELVEARLRGDREASQGPLNAPPKPAPKVTVWDYYAAQSLSGLLASGKIPKSEIAGHASHFADLMLLERERRTITECKHEWTLSDPSPAGPPWTYCRRCGARFDETKHQLPRSR